MHHVALDRAGAHDRHLDDEVVELRGFSRGSIDICARLSTWKTPSGIGAAGACVDAVVLGGNRRQRRRPP
jgi:hypothetical protein